MKWFSYFLAFCFACAFLATLRIALRKDASAAVLGVLTTLCIALAVMTYMPELDTFKALGTEVHLNHTISAADERLARLALLNAKVTYKAEAQALTPGTIGRTQERLDEVDLDLAGQGLTDKQWRAIREPFFAALKNAVKYRIVSTVGQVMSTEGAMKLNVPTQGQLPPSLQSYQQQVMSIVGMPTWDEVRRTLQPPAIVPAEVRGRMMAYVDKAIDAYESSERAGRISPSMTALLDQPWPDQLSAAKRIWNGD